MTVECTVHDQCTGLRMYTVSYTAFGCSQDGRCVSVSTDISAVCNVPITTMSCTTSGCNGGNSTQATPIPSEGSWLNSAAGFGSAQADCSLCPNVCGSHGSRLCNKLWYIYGHFARLAMLAQDVATVHCGI